MGSRGKLTIVVLLVGIAVSGIYLGRFARAGGVAPAAAQKKLSRKQQQLASAKVTYLENCARCHGAEGAADTEQAEIYNATNFTDAGWWRKERPSNARMRRVIANGGSGMPAFAKRLSAAKINALIPFVRAFKGK